LIGDSGLTADSFFLAYSAMSNGDLGEAPIEVDDGTDAEY
jgi:hypothetical protein